MIEPTPTKPLAGARFLLAEDEGAIALHYETIIAEAGGEAIVTATVAGGLEGLRSGRIRAALIDVELRGESSFALANALILAGTPFAFVSGHYRRDELVGPYAKVPFIDKPAAPKEIVAVLARLIGRAEPPPASPPATG